MRILMAEDDPMLARGLRQALLDGGMSVDWVRDGPSAKEALGDNGYAAALLDLGLPTVDGMSVLESVRARGVRTPIVIITANDDLQTRIRGLDMGADDFVTKPFEVTEILARMRAVVRRHAGSAVSCIGTQELSLNIETYELQYRGHCEVLGYREFALMRALMERPGTILSRSQIEDRIYGWGEEVESNAIEVLIYHVRRRFGKSVIRNVRGAGWMVEKS